MIVGIPHGIKLPKTLTGQALLPYYHSTASRRPPEGLLRTGVVAIAYKSITDKQEHLPLLTPMSETAGTMSTQEGKVANRAVADASGMEFRPADLQERE